MAGDGALTLLGAVGATFGYARRALAELPSRTPVKPSIKLHNALAQRCVTLPADH